MNQTHGDPRWDDVLARLVRAEQVLSETRALVIELRQGQDLAPAPLPTAVPVSPSPANNPYSVRQPAQPAAVAPPVARKASLSGEQLLIRVIAAAGILITVLGVGFAITVAIQNGWLGPLWRVVLTAILAIVLLGGAILIDRAAKNHIAVGALSITSLLTAVLLILSLVDVLNWWSPGIGALALIGVWILYLGVRRLFHWVPLAVVLSVLAAGLAVFYPYLSEPSDLLTWSIVSLPFLTLAGTIREINNVPRHWAMLSTAIAVLFLASDGGIAVSPLLLALLTIIAIVAIILREPIANRTDLNVCLAAAGIAVLAAVVHIQFVGGFGFGLPLILLGVYIFSPRLALAHRETPVAQLRKHSAWMIPISLLFIWQPRESIYTSSFAGFTWNDAAQLAILAGFCVFLLVANQPSRERSVGMVGWIIAVFVVNIPTLVAVMGLDPTSLIRPAAVVVAVLCAIAVIILVAKHRQFADARPPIVWSLAVLSLLLSMYAVVMITVWVANLLGGRAAMENGYIVGHTFVSIGWMLVAAWALLGRVRIPGSWSLWVGGVLAAAAVLKLVFFDLQALTGLGRALAFLACGLVLLAIVSLRARQGHNR